MHKYVGEDASQMVALGRAKVPVKDGKSQSVGTEICYFYFIFLFRNSSKTHRK